MNKVLSILVFTAVSFSAISAHAEYKYDFIGEEVYVMEYRDVNGKHFKTVFRPDIENDSNCGLVNSAYICKSDKKDAVCEKKMWKLNSVRFHPRGDVYNGHN